MLPPPPSSYLEEQVPPRQPFSFTGGPPTPPPTTQMTSYSSRQLPDLHYTQNNPQAEEMSYPIRTQVPSINHPPPQYSYSSEPPQSNAAQNLMSTMQRSPPSTLSTLVLPVPTENKKSPQTGMTLKLPSTIRAPQANLSQLAAEVCCQIVDSFVPEVLTFIGNMSVLVRERQDFVPNRAPASSITLLSSHLRRFHANREIQALGSQPPVYHPGHTKRDHLGPVLHLEIEKLQSHRQRSPWQRVSLTDSGFDAR